MPQKFVAPAVTGIHPCEHSLPPQKAAWSTTLMVKQALWCTEERAALRQPIRRPCWRGEPNEAAVTFTAMCSSSSFVRWFKLRVEDVMWKGAMVAAVFFLLAACAADEEQRRAQQEEYAKAAAQAEAQIAQQDHARCLSYGKPGSAAYIDCRSSLKNDRADMKN
jgi:hypothetical protein